MKKPVVYETKLFNHAQIKTMAQLIADEHFKAMLSEQGQLKEVRSAVAYYFMQQKIGSFTAQDLTDLYVALQYHLCIGIGTPNSKD